MGMTEPEYKCICGKPSLCEVDDWEKNPYPCFDHYQRWNAMRINKAESVQPLGRLTQSERSAHPHPRTDALRERLGDPSK